MENIIVKPGDVWAFFNREVKNGHSQMPIAVNDEYGAEIALCSDNGFPSFTVCLDDDVIDEEVAINEIDCEDTARRLYAAYISSEIFSTLSDRSTGFEAAYERKEQQEVVDEREEELNWALGDFLSVVAPDAQPDGDEIEDIKDAVLELLAREFDMQIYRPMFLEDDAGVEFYEEFPYECMVFEDEE